jgi:predicted SAM-dependent methyltransferase
MKIQVGSGPNSKPGWLNIDLDERADLRLDLREPLPLPDGCASIVYGEHMFEHLEHPSETTRFLAECLRVLEAGGHLSLVVPDCGFVMRAYVEGDSEFFTYAKKHWHPDTCRTWMDQVNFAFRQGAEHRYAWDEETLLLALTDAGFVHGRRRDFDPELDDERRGIYGALLVEARKPS